MSMTKADIVERIYKEAGFSKKEAAELVDLVFKVIKDTLAKGEKVKFPVSETSQSAIKRRVSVVTHKRVQR